MRPSRLTRRKFLEAAAAAAATTSLASCGGGSGAGPSREVFTEAEARTAEAICERIVPADADPGAAWAGVVGYIDRQLAGPFRDWVEKYRAGLAGVDQASAALFAKPFADLSAAEQDSVLAAMEKDAAPGEAWKKVPAKAFFDQILDHARQGFYGDPRHGGNRDGAAWKMLGLAYPPVRGRRHEPRWLGR